MQLLKTRTRAPARPGVGRMSADSGGDLTAEGTKRRLVEAVKDGHEARVVELLDEIGWHVLHSVSFPYTLYYAKDTGTLLHVACRYRQPKLVKLFLENNANANARSSEKRTSPLHVSAWIGDEEICAQLIASGCTVDAVDVSMRTPLYFAGLHERNVVAELLIKHSADVNHADAMGWRPLHHAARRGKFNMIKLLVDAGADINCLTRHGKTPLHHACNQGNVFTAELLVHLGADITITDKKQHTALYDALNQRIEIIDEGARHFPERVRIARLLIAVAGLYGSARDAGNFQQQKALLKAESDYAFACALKTVDKHLKHDALEYAGVNVSQDLDRASRLHALQNALAENCLEKVCILASAGEAMKFASAEAVAESLCLALARNSPELALAVLQSNSGQKIDSELLCLILRMGVSWKSVPLTLAAVQIEISLPIADEALRQAVELGFANLSFVVDLCKVGVLDAAGPQATVDVLSFALEQSSAELALLACKACRAHAKADVPHTMMRATLDLALYTASLMLTIEAIQGGALESASSDVVGKAVHLGLETESFALLQAVLSWANIGHLTFPEVLRFALEKESTKLALLTSRACLRFNVVAPDSLIQATMKLALKSSLEELAIVACQGGALSSASSERVSEVLRLGLKTKSIMLLKTAGSLTEVGTPTFVDVLQFALEQASAELTLIASKACAHFDEAVPHSLMEATLQLGLQESSAELAIVACQGGALTAEILKPATAPGDTLLCLLQLAVQGGSAQLAIIVFKAGAVKSADHQLLAQVVELAIKTSSIELLSILVNAGTLRHSTDKVKEKVLHQAAIAGDLQLADQCILSGVFHGVDQWDKPTAIDVATQRGHSRLAEKLRKALDSHKLLSLGQRDANTVLIRVVGPPGAGKSTLVKSLRTSRLWGFFRWESQADEGDKNFQTRTKGIQVDSYKDSSGTCYRILDLGGQHDFSCANQLFIGEGQVPIINVVAISSLKDLLAIEDEVLKWSSFFASRFDRSNFQPEAHLQPVIVVATRSESATAIQMENVEKAVHKAGRLEAFGKFLDFRHGPVFVDSRKSWGQGMERLRLLLADVAKDVLKRAPPQAALCNDIQRALPSIRAKVRHPIISRKELPELVAEERSSWWRPFDKNVIESHSDLLDAALRQMSDACEILSFEPPALKDLLVIHPPWLLHDVVGVLLSPANFPPPRVLYDKNGRASRKQAEKALRANCGPGLVEGGVALHMVAQLGLSILDDSPDGSTTSDGMIVPSKLEISRYLHAILSPGNLSPIWFGIELQCTEVPLAVCLFSQLQVHLYSHLLMKCKQKPLMWSGGIAVALRHEQVVGIVEARHGRVAIDIIVQGTEATRRTCYCLLQVLKEETLLKAQKFSPGSDITEKVLSSRELSTLDWSKSSPLPRIMYEREDVHKAIKHGKIRPQHDDESLCVLEDAFDLMAIPPTHVILMTTDGYKRFCYRMNSLPSSGARTAKWQELARRLGMPQHEMPSMSSTDVTNPADVILQRWSRLSHKHTIERLLTAVKPIGDGEAVSILEKELSFSLTTLPGDSESSPGTATIWNDSPVAHAVDGTDNTMPQTCTSPVHRQSVPSTPNEDTQVQTEQDSSLPAHVEEHSPLPAGAEEHNAPPNVEASSSSGAPVVMKSTLRARFIQLSSSPDSVPHGLSSASANQPSLSSAPAKDPEAFQPSTNPAATLSKARTLSSLAEDRHVQIGQVGSQIAAERELVKASTMFYDMLECKQLAVYLEISDGGRIVSAWKSSNPGMSVSDVAYKILQTWKEEKKSTATSAALQRVLRDKLKKKDAVERIWPVLSTPSAVCSGSDTRPPIISASNKAQPERTLSRPSLEDEIPETAIMDVALNFADIRSCTQLAVFLDISQGSRFVENLSPHADNRERAYDVMMEWKKENGRAATGEWLYKVLHGDLNMKDLAEKLRRFFDV